MSRSRDGLILRTAVWVVIIVYFLLVLYSFYTFVFLFLITPFDWGLPFLKQFVLLLLESWILWIWPRAELQSLSCLLCLVLLILGLLEWLLRKLGRILSNLLIWNKGLSVISIAILAKSGCLLKTLGSLTRLGRIDWWLLQLLIVVLRWGNWLLPGIKFLNRLRCSHLNHLIWGRPVLERLLHLRWSILERLLHLWWSILEGRIHSRL
jgi:hypothetical protein